MANTRHMAVVVLYAHPLLGQGVGKLLMAEPGVEIVLVHGTHAAAADAALAAQPDVVVLERGVPVTPMDVLRAAPGALLIDIGMDTGPTWTYRRERIEPDALLRTIRRLRGAARAIAVDEPAEATGARS